MNTIKPLLALRLLASLSLISIFSTACSTTDGLTRAAADQGKISAGIHIPDQPAECSKDTPHVAKHLGDDPVVIIKRSDAQLDAANRSKHNCFVWNDRLHKGLVASPGQGAKR